MDEHNDIQQIRHIYNDKLSNEKSIIAYLDLANMFPWQNILRWNFKIEDVIKQLFSIRGMKKIRVYYGLNNLNQTKATQS